MNNAFLSTSEFAEKYIELLQPLENSVVRTYREIPSLHDHDVLRVYEALLKYVKAKLTNYPLPQPKLEGTPLSLYLEQLSFIETQANSYSFKEIQECLKLLEKSVKLWNREFGSRGYFNYISRFSNGISLLGL